MQSRLAGEEERWEGDINIFFFMYDDDVSREIRERELEDVVVL